MGPKSAEALRVIAERPSYPAAALLPTDLEWGIFNQNVLRVLRKEKLLKPFRLGKPLELTAAGTRKAQELPAAS
ncbi:MAG: hypothetical protein WC054_01155 [Candidatus Nanopelagicales bacterium]